MRAYYLGVKGRLRAMWRRLGAPTSYRLATLRPQPSFARSVK
jgi:hypothetical protein